MRLPTACAVLLLVVASPALAKECRMPNLPPGKEVRLPPGCEAPVATGRTKAQRQDSLRTEQGFINLGNGTQVRIGGRVRAETGFSR
jgi:hypothetical protein